MSSKSLDKFLEDPTPGNRMVGTVILIALALVVGAILFGWSSCSRPKPIQMIATPAETPMPAASSAAIASSSAAATATGRFRAVIPIGALKPTLDVAPQARRTGASGQSILPPGLASGPSQSAGKAAFVEASNGTDPGTIVIEFDQVLTTTATSSAQAAAAVGVIETSPTHGRLGVVALTAPGILAASWQLGSVEIPSWVAGMPLEVGLDLEGNLEHIGAGASVGGKGFAFAGYWIGYNLIAHGPSIGVGLRF